MTIVDYHQAKTLKQLSLYNPQNIFCEYNCENPKLLVQDQSSF